MRPEKILAGWCVVSAWTWAAQGLALEQVFQGHNGNGTRCEVALVFDDEGALSQVRLNGEMSDTLYCLDLIGGRAGRLEYEATFDSAVNFVDGEFTVERGLFGGGDIISGVGYRMPYDPGRYEAGYEPTAKQKITVKPSLKNPESVHYQARDLFVPFYPLGGICQAAVNIGSGWIPLSVAELECFDLSPVSSGN